MHTNELVSVVVVTYNSEKTVIETLDSIASQTYRNIELIVSDDASQDKTVELCKEWIKMNGSRFVRTILLCSQENHGTSKNINTGEANANGLWVKSIAADDLLTPNCIRDCIDFVTKNPDTIFLFGKVEYFSTSKKKEQLYANTFDYDFFKKDIYNKFQHLINNGNCIPAPSLFSNIVKRRQLGLIYDERIPLLEDLPLWVKATKQGVDLKFVDKVVCKYRVGGNGITSGKGNRKFSESLRRYYLYYVFPEEYKVKPDEAINKIVKYEEELFGKTYGETTYKIRSAIVGTLKKILRNMIRF